MVSGCGKLFWASTETSGTTGWLNCTMMRASALPTGVSLALSAGDVVTMLSVSVVSPVGNRLPGFRIDTLVAAGVAGTAVAAGGTNAVVGCAVGGVMGSGLGVGAGP